MNLWIYTDSVEMSGALKWDGTCDQWNADL